MEKEQQTSLFHSIITMVVVIIESFFSLILRFDDKLRQAAYPLASNNSVVVIRSYLPHEELYLTFTFKGVLIDTTMPDHKEHADIIINAHSFEIANAIISDKQKAIDKLQYRGNTEEIEQLKDFLLVLSFNGFVENLLSYFNKKTISQLDDKKPSNEERNSASTAKKQVVTLKSELDSARIRNTKLNTQVAEFESKNKSTLPLVLITLFIGVGIGRFFL